MQIRTRLTLQYLVITASIIMLALLFIYFQFLQYSEKEYFTLLESKARTTADMVLRAEPDLKLAEIIPNNHPDNSIALPYHENTAIYDERLKLVFSMVPGGTVFTENELLCVSREGNYCFSKSKFQVFGTMVQSASGASYIVITEGIFDHSKLNKLRNILIVTFFLIVGIVAASGWFFAGQALRPVARIVTAVDEILPADLSRRLASDNKHDELGRLVATFNQLLERVEHAFLMQRSFISNVSHELRNPLAAITAQIQLARQKERSVEEYQRVLSSLHEDIQDLTATEEKLLQLARLYSDANHIAFSPLRLDELLLQTRDTLLKSAPQYFVSTEICDMPPLEEQLNIIGNESLLRTALINLLDNSCKFSSDAKATVKVWFRENGEHEVHIRDNGLGIPADDLQRIFEPFYRSTQHSKIKGSGIGLSLVRSIAKLHNINITVESTLNRGTIFVLQFPAFTSIQQ